MSLISRGRNDSIWAIVHILVGMDYRHCTLEADQTKLCFCDSPVSRLMVHHHFTIEIEIETLLSTTDYKLALHSTIKFTFSILILPFCPTICNSLWIILNYLRAFEEVKNFTEHKAERFIFNVKNANGSRLLALRLFGKLQSNPWPHFILPSSK